MFGIWYTMWQKVSEMKIEMLAIVAWVTAGSVSAATDAALTFRDGWRNCYQGYVNILVDEAATGFTVTNHSGSTTCIAWGQMSKKFPVPVSSANWSLDFMIRAESTWYRVETERLWRNAVKFYDSHDRVVGQEDLEIEFPAKKPLLPFRFTGKVPANAVQATVQFGVDSKPTIRPGETVQVSDVRFAFYGMGEKVPVRAHPDMSAPLVRSLFESPSMDENLVARYRVEDQSAIDWSKVSVSNPVTQAFVPFRREGNELVLQPGQPWPKGVSRLEIRAADILGHETVAKKVFLVGEERRVPFATLRDDGITLLGGRPFYPVGIYGVSLQDFNGNSFVKAFADLKAGGLNMGQSYTSWSDPRYFEGAHASGIVSFTWGKGAVRGEDWFMKTGRAEDSIIAWYIGDDTSMHMTAQELLDHDEACRMLDGRRLTCQADGVGATRVKSNLQDYVDYTDVFLAEIYPYDGTKDDQSVAEVCRAMDRCFSDCRTFADPRRPHAVWAILQCFHGCSWHYYPSPAEMYASSFAAVAHGAQGMTWFMYGGEIVKGKSRYSGMFRTPETWNAMTNIMTRISQLSPILVERTPIQPAVPEIVVGPAADPFGKPAVTCLLKEHAGDVYVIAVNAATRPVRARFSLPGLGGQVSVVWENRELTFENCAFEDDFAVNGVHVYRVRKGK